jgi:hypothetical protein
MKRMKKMRDDDGTRGRCRRAHLQLSTQAKSQPNSSASRARTCSVTRTRGMQQVRGRSIGGVAGREPNERGRGRPASRCGGGARTWRGAGVWRPLWWRGAPAGRVLFGRLAPLRARPLTFAAARYASYGRPVGHAHARVLLVAEHGGTWVRTAPPVRSPISPP